jgi:hypothetical protein
VKTTVEIPDQLFRQAKARAAERGQSLKQLMTEALRAQLARGRGAAAAEPAWMRGFGGLRHLRGETRRVQARVDEAFETIEPEDRA